MALEFKLTIRLGNDAMQTDGDLAEALHKVAALLDRSAEQESTREHTQSIFDLNGNRVGGWKIEERES